MPVGAPLILYKGDVFYAPARDLCEDFAPRDGTLRPSGDGGSKPRLGKTGRPCWRLTPRKSLIFRRGAPRCWTRKGLRSGERGASHASKP